MVAFYVGVDIDTQALISKIDGAISRYDKQRRIKANHPKMYFIQGDTSAELDIESQKTAFGSAKLVNEQFLSKFFSKNQKERTLFDIINCQLAIHYLLKNELSWTNFKKNISNYLRNGGYMLATTFDAEKIMKLIGDKDRYTQSYTDENGKVKVLYDIVKKYQDDDVSGKHVGVGNPIDVYISWFSNEGRYLTEYLVDSKFLISELDKDCNMELVDTDSLGNQFNIHKDFFTKYAKYEEVPETRKFLLNVSKFYEKNEVNTGSQLWNSLFRYYVFRKRELKTQKGGGILDFSDSNKYEVPNMKGYDNEYTFFNSIHHIMRNQRIIPKTIFANKLYKDLGIEMKKDIDLDSFNKISRKIIIEHITEDDKSEIIVDGLNIFVVERDCNDNYDIDLIKKDKKIKDDDLSIILMKEGYLYVPLYSIDKETGKRVGIMKTTNQIVQQMISEL
jgi:hypothetical protein